MFSLTSWPWTWRHYTPSKWEEPLAQWHSITSPKDPNLFKWLVWFHNCHFSNYLQLFFESTKIIYAEEYYAFSKRTCYNLCTETQFMYIQQLIHVTQKTCILCGKSHFMETFWTEWKYSIPWGYFWDHIIAAFQTENCFKWNPLN
jgi:ferredoxin-like protein FixX